MREQVGYGSEDILSSSEFGAGQLVVWEPFPRTQGKGMPLPSMDWHRDRI